MARFTLHLILVAAISACPLWCSTGHCASGDECTSSDGCPSALCEVSSCCPSQKHQQQPKRTSPPAESSPCDVCQCICSGAVVQLQEAVVTQQVENPLHEAIVANESAIETLHSPTSWRYALDEDAAFSGLSLRILHSSMLL